MTQTIIALLSILAGILGSNIFGIVFKKYSSGIIGNTILGVFGSIFFIKLFGRLGFNPNSIMETGDVNLLLFIVNIVISLLGGVFAVFIANKIKSGLNKRKTGNHNLIK
ncbi:MAG: hypothetical protein GQ525_08930 [Draconibacterium sp.]|nr:hypothetical protein [Draconibacterium sp.]